MDYRCRPRRLPRRPVAVLDYSASAGLEPGADGFDADAVPAPPSVAPSRAVMYPGSNVSPSVPAALATPYVDRRSPRQLPKDRRGRCTWSVFRLG